MLQKCPNNDVDLLATSLGRAEFMLYTRFDLYFSGEVVTVSNIIILNQNTESHLNVIV